MAEEWADLASIATDVSYGYTESASSEAIGPRFLRITDIQGGRVDWSNVPFCPIGAADLLKYRLLPDDIVVARTGNTTGENYLVREAVDAVFASYLIRFRIDRGRADPAFVWYQMRSKRWWSFIHNSRTGSAQAGANAKVLGRFQVALPPLDEQRAVARVLGAIDDKIEMSRRVAETLEEMARALFRSWFVDFDPVRAKAEGRETGLPSEIADLFPDRLVDSGLGEIPDGWTASPLSVHLTESTERVGTRSGITEYSSTNEGLARRDVRFKKVLNASPAGNKVVRRGNAVFGMSRRELNFGVMHDEVGAVSGAYKVFSVGGLSPSYFERFVRSRSSYFLTAAAGSSREGQSFSTAALQQLHILTPAAAVLEQFERSTDAWADQTRALNAQVMALTELRDALLPKLVSGEVRIGDPDGFLERLEAVG